MHSTAWRLACFDLDGTLVPHASTGQHLATKLGHSVEMAELERAYAAGLATNADVAAMDGRHFRGLTQSDVSNMLDDIAVIPGTAQTVEWLSARGIPSVICTLAWRFVGEVFAERYGFIASSGPTLKVDQYGVFTGEVESDFSESDKPGFVGSLCDSLGIGMSEVFHIGDSRSDVELFKAVGYSVALNATADAAQTASVALEAGSLFDVLDVIPGLKR